MKKSGLFIMLFIALIVIAVITVPTKTEYKDWMKSQLSEQADSKLDSFLTNALGGVVIDNTTTVKNFVAFSIFDSEIDNEHYVTIGAFRNFFRIL